jgi:TolB-like protein
VDQRDGFSRAPQFDESAVKTEDQTSRHGAERKLAAIVASDVAGYSRLMGVDEIGTARRLREYQTVVSAIVREHGGRVVNIAGDGMLLEFLSVVNAVQCAVAMQRLVAQRNDDIPDDGRMLLRIGIDVGDVLIVGEDILGVGVNIAARLEAIAEPGGICVSRAVYEQSKGKVVAEFIDLGKQHLKNIAEPVYVYAIGPESGATKEMPKSTPLAGDTPHLSIVVLPFVTIVGEAGQEYFADAITDALTTDLSRIPDALVIARNSAFTYKGRAVDVRQVGRELGVRYAVEGSVQSGDDRLRINVQLVDAESGAHLWAERFDRERGELFDMQDAIVTRLARALGTELVAAEARRAERSSAADPNALGLVFRGWAALYRGYSPINLREAERCFERAVALAPSNVSGLVGVAAAKFTMAATRTVHDGAAYLTAAEAAAMKALALSPNDARAHAALGWIYIGTNRPTLGIAEAERSIVLDRNLAPSHAAIGWAKILLGRAEETEQHIAQALRVSPRDTYAYAWYHIAGNAKLVLGRFHEAVAWLRRTVEANRTYPIGLFSLAAALAHQGRFDEARAAVAQGLAIVPTFTIRRYRNAALSDHPIYLIYLERTIHGLRKAGVPEDEVAPAEAGPVSPSASQAIAPPVLSETDFVSALRKALRDFGRPDLLAHNPLLRSRLLIGHAAAGPAELQALLSGTVEALFAGPRDEKLRRVVETTYFCAVPKQEAAADRLGLAFGTYRRHLATARRRLCAWLWHREQETSPASD